MLTQPKVQLKWFEQLVETNRSGLGANSSQATICLKRQFVSIGNSSQIPKSDNSSQSTIRPEFQKATIRLKRQFVSSDNSSKVTIRLKRQFVSRDNSSQATIRIKRPFVSNDNSSLQCIDKLFLAILRKPRHCFAESKTRLRNSNLFDVCGI